MHSILFSLSRSTMKRTTFLTFVLVFQIICGIFASASDEKQVEGISIGIEQDLVSIISTALKYVSSDKHQSICSKFIPPNKKLTEPSFKWKLSAPQYKGCFEDKSGRMFEKVYFLLEISSVKSCTDLCRAEGFLYAGLQYSADCYCGNNLPNPLSYPKIDDKECNFECTRNKDEKCGGKEAMSIFETGNQGKCHLNISYLSFLTFNSTVIQVIDRDGNVADENPFESPNEYTKYIVTVYVETAENQQEIGDKVEADRNTWSKPVLTFDIPKIDKSEEQSDVTGEDQQEIDEKEKDDNTGSKFLSHLWMPQKIDEIQTKPKTFFHFFDVETFDQSRETKQDDEDSIILPIRGRFPKF